MPWLEGHHIIIIVIQKATGLVWAYGQIIQKHGYDNIDIVHIHVYLSGIMINLVVTPE